MTRPKILLIEHAPKRADGFSDFLYDQPVDIELVRVYESLRLPSLKKYQGIISSGGPMGAYEINKQEYKFLKDESEYLLNAIQLDIPLLGVCLGHQLIAQALGGEVRKASVSEYGWYPVTLTTRGLEDRLFVGTEPQFDTFQYHGDEVTRLPSNALILATSSNCEIQAFKLINQAVWGIQFHAEISPTLGEKILLSRKDALIEYGIDVNNMTLKGHQIPSHVGKIIFRNFIEVVLTFANSIER